MKVDKVVEILAAGNTSIPNFWFQEYKKIGLTDEEFIFLIGLINKGTRFKNNTQELTKFYNLEPTKILTIISSLEDKKIIKFEIEKDKSNKLTEIINITPFYEKMSMVVIDNKNSEEKESDIFSIFEKEFGRTLSPMEYEIINKWLEDDLREDIVLEALKEAVYNGAHSLRYIDKILYEWRKKGIKSKEDIQKGYKQAKKEIKNKEIFDYNWLEDNENK